MKTRVMLASAEVDPFAKVGGLADVAGSLPKALAERGVDIRVIMPKYRVAAKKAGKMERAAVGVDVQMPTWKTACAVDVTTLPGSDVPVYMIEHNEYFDREGIYGPAGGAYPDSAERLAFFCRATLAAMDALGFEADLVHLNDWHTALIAAYATQWDLPFATLFTGHNLGGSYQGTFSGDFLSTVGLDLGDARVARACPGGQINLARVGLVFSDMINTVSEKYAEELRDVEMGGTLSELIVERGDDVWGIVNGIDYDTWSPEIDDAIIENYSSDDREGKAACKAALQAEFGLPVDPDIPLIGLVTRLDAQKGLDLVAEMLNDMGEYQVALLGTGDAQLETLFARATILHKNVAARLEFSGSIARMIYAGSDMFLMPSHYEPCGLGQMIALAYGTIPIVRRTGGLADTIRSKGDNTNGFDFEEYSVPALKKAVDAAVEAYADSERWERLVDNAFASDYSWDASAKRYEKLYKAAMKKRR